MKAKNQKFVKNNIFVKKNIQIFLILVGIILSLLLIVILATNLVYRGKIFIGAKANGINIGGKTKDEALKELNQKTETYLQKPITLSDEAETWQIYPAEITLNYQNKQLVDKIYDLTNSTNIFTSLFYEFAIISGFRNNFTDFTYDKSLLANKILPISKGVASPVNNATFSIDNGELIISPETLGKRLDLEELITNLEKNISLTDANPVDVPVYNLGPTISEKDLRNLESQVQDYVQKSLVLTYSDKTFAPSKSTILSWVKLSSDKKSEVTRRDPLSLFAKKSFNFNSTLNSEAISNYLISFSDQINKKSKNAGLAFDSSLKIVSPSQDGRELNINSSIEKIVNSLNKKSGGDKRIIPLIVDIKRPDIREDNLASLGINELISEGITYFPGSPPNRLTNVRIGSSRFNRIVVAPNEVFSFGELLGPVGPEQGYTPGLVILENREEKQYGGGMCQVSSTAFRAALQAGLPILERHSHAFAVSYYTAPYGVPGVDATIYYPPVDFKFKNDTGSYILIQTLMSGTTLKFSFYGTKNKSGRIRGPEFVSGSNDVNQPSHTVFYRDVLDLNGKVLKTDNFHTYYRPASDFPIVGD